MSALPTKADIKPYGPQRPLSANSGPVSATSCLFGDATYMKMKIETSETPLSLEAANKVNGIFLRRGEHSQQFFLDMPNSPPPNYKMGIMDTVTQISYPTFVIQADGDKPSNEWPADNRPAPERIIIKGIGEFQRVCPN